jgi:glycine/D-amino acid oxidase-like deaminating enzyme
MPHAITASGMSRLRTAVVAARRALSSATPCPLWLDDPSAPPAETPLDGTRNADLVIVGGGLSGLWGAVVAKESWPDLDVVILEASRIASGASGRAGGIVSTSLMHGLTNEARVFPRDIAVLERLGMENLQAVRSAIERYRIECQVEWTGEMKVAASADRVAYLQEEFELHVRHGHDVVMLGRDELRAHIRSPLMHAGMWSRQRSGIINPARLAWGLRRAALRLGVRIHETSPVRSLRQEADRVRIRTERGEIRALRVLLATNAWSGVLPAVRNRVLTAHDQVLATEPLTAGQLASVGWRFRQGIYDTRTQLNYMRLTSNNRIVFGGHVGYFFNNAIDPKEDRDVQSFTALATTFTETFPQLEDVRVTHVWGGPIDYCKRVAMFFQRFLQGRAIWVGGYSGFGVAASRFGAATALDILFERRTCATSLDIATTFPGGIPGEPLRWLGATLTNYALARADRSAGWQRVVNFMRMLGYPL